MLQARGATTQVVHLSELLARSYEKPTEP
jgi:hypothetical protein